MRKLLLAALVAGTAAPAFAQEANPFTGFRLEAIGGYDSLKSGEQDSDESIDGFTRNVEVGRDIYVGGRVGMQVAPSTLLYAKGGYTNLAVEADYEGPDDTFEFNDNADGFRVGAGVEQLFGPNAYGKLEYRYSNYNNLDFSDDFDLDDFDAEDFDTDIDLDRHQVVAAVGWRF